MKVITKTNGNPFTTKAIAKMMAERNLLDDNEYKIVAVEDGFVIEVREDGDPAPDPAKPKAEEQAKPKAEEQAKPKAEEQAKPKAEEQEKPKAEEQEKPKVEDFELNENNVSLDADYEQPYPRAHFTGDFKKPKVTYIPKECKNPRFTYKFLLVEKFQHGIDMCDNWQVDREVIRNMRNNRKYRHLVSESEPTLKRGKMNELILCRMPIEYKEAWQKEQRELNRAMLGNVTNKENDIYSAGLGA